MNRSSKRKTGAIALLLGSTLAWQGMVVAQETTEAVTPVSADVEDLGYLDEAELDALTSPIALYPDTLLGQVLVATTYPMDVMKADRFLTANADLSDDARVKAVNEQPWSDSVKSLAAGFPELISRMAEHSDWTETMGEALVVQTDDVLVSIQRLRAQAEVNGYLEDNAAMTVETDPETQNITIASTDPNVVYVPEYTNAVYYQPAPTTPYYVYDNNNSNDWGDALMTGAVIWGTAVIIDNIFDNDWDNGWDNGYWHGNGGNSIDWNGDINIDNGINIGNGNVGNGIGNGIGNRPEIGNGDTIIGGDKIGGGDRTQIGDRTGIGNGDRGGVDIGEIGKGEQIGGVGQDRLDKARDANFKPTAADRDAAREKIAAKQAAGAGISTLPAATGRTKDGVKGYTPPAQTKLGGGDGKPKATAKPATAKPATKPSTKPAGKPSTAKVSKPKTPSKPPAKARPAASAPVFEPQGGSRAGAASARGKASRGGR